MRLQGQRSISANFYNSATVSLIASKLGLMMLGDDLYVYMCVKFDIMNINEVGGA